jgi:hypothetical protein
MSEPNDRKSAKISRREMGRAAMGIVSGVLVAGTVPAEAQDKPKPASEVDTRVGLIEKSYGKALTDEQRKTIQENIKSSDDAWIKGREFMVPDGTEPDFIFTPTPLKALGRRNG